MRNYQEIRPSGGTFIVAVVASLALLIASKWEGLLGFSQFLTRIVWPIQYVVNFPTHMKDVAEPLLIHQDQLAKVNQDLQREQVLLQAQVQKLRALEAENHELRELLKSVSHNKETYSEGRLVHANIDPFLQQVLLNKGKMQGIEVGQPVIDSFGLVGVVTGLNEYTSQVLLVTDPGFAVPVQSVRSGERAIANGSGTGGELRLNYVPRTADFIEGDVLVTSGIGGRFPAGYPVGTITSIQHDPSTRFTLVAINPMAKLGRLRHVLFVKHNPHAQPDTAQLAEDTHNEVILTPPTPIEPASQETQSNASDQSNTTQTSPEQQFTTGSPPVVAPTIPEPTEPMQ